MFKKQFRKWGIDRKHIRARDALQIRELKGKRDAMNKSSVILVRGQKVEWENIRRHLSRNPKLKATADSSFQISKNTIDIILRTPSPDPIIKHAVKLPPMTLVVGSVNVGNHRLGIRLE